MNTVNSVDDYEYAHLPLTPTLMGSLVRRLYSSGDVVRRDEMVEKVVSYHKANGGVFSKVTPVSQMKKALGDLSASGLVEQTGVYGLWRIIDAEDNPGNTGGRIEVPESSIVDESNLALRGSECVGS